MTDKEYLERRNVIEVKIEELRKENLDYQAKIQSLNLASVLNKRHIINLERELKYLKISFTEQQKLAYEQHKASATDTASANTADTAE